jgi:hypothetical protein
MTLAFAPFRRDPTTASQEKGELPRRGADPIGEGAGGGATLEFCIAKKPDSSQLELIREEPPVRTKGGKKFADLLAVPPRKRQEYRPIPPREKT